MIVFPLISICLLAISSVSALPSNRGQTPVPFPIALALNGVFLVWIAAFTALFWSNNEVITQIPALYYWFLLAAGIVVELFSFRKRYAPGHLTAAALHIFFGFVAILSLGVFFLALAVLELCIAFYQLRSSRRITV